MTRHYSQNSEYDNAWCGADVLMGGSSNIYDVTCLACLSAVEEAGKCARARFEAVIRDITYCDIKWTAFCLVFGNIAGHEAYNSVTDSKLSYWMVK